MSDNKVKARLERVGLYPTKYGVTEYGSEEHRAENTLGITNALPALDPADLLAVRIIVVGLEPEAN